MEDTVLRIMKNIPLQSTLLLHVVFAFVNTKNFKENFPPEEIEESDDVQESIKFVCLFFFSKFLFQVFLITIGLYLGM